MLECKDVIDLLNQSHIHYELIEHIAIYVIDNDADFLHKERCVKNLFLRDDKKRNYYLVVVRPDKRVNLKELSQTIHSRRLSFASPDDLYKYLGVQQGAVTPLGILNDINHQVHLILDSDIHGLVGVHPLVNTASVFLDYQDLKDFIRDQGFEFQEVKIV